MVTFVTCLTGAANADVLGPEVKSFVTVEAPVVALTHVRVIDGTGAPAREDQTVLIVADKLAAVGRSAEVRVPAGAKVLERRGCTVMPGIVGMHDHLFYAQVTSDFFPEAAFSSTRLYLASGVTTIRTAGSYDPYTDLETKRWVDSGRWVGPKMHVTAPYLEGPGAFTPQMHELRSPDDARRMVAFWAEQGSTSFKAFMHITRAQLAAAIDEAHKHHLKLTAHLCSVGFTEAVEMGIDNLEHGLLEDREFVPGKKPDVCVESQAYFSTMKDLKVESKPVQDLIALLVSRRVAVTSTLAVFESKVSNRSDTGACRGGAGAGRVDPVPLRAGVHRRRSQQSTAVRFADESVGRDPEDGNGFRARVCEGGRTAGGRR